MNIEETIMINSRKNRIKVILQNIGIKWRNEGQPINSDKLNELGISAYSMKDIIENRRQITHQEAAVIAMWLGVDYDDLFEDSNTDLSDLIIKIKLRVA